MQTKRDWVVSVASFPHQTHGLIALRRLRRSEQTLHELQERRLLTSGRAVAQCCRNRHSYSNRTGRSRTHFENSHLTPFVVGVPA